MLQDKHRIVFCGGGSVGRMVALRCAADIAEVFASRRTKSNVDEVTRQITDVARCSCARVEAQHDEVRLQPSARPLEGVTEFGLTITCQPINCGGCHE